MGRPLVHQSKELSQILAIFLILYQCKSLSESVMKANSKTDTLVNVREDWGAHTKFDRAIEGVSGKQIRC